MRILSGSAARREIEKFASGSLQSTTKERAVQRIVSEVRRRGDSALRNYAKRWDRLGTRSLRVTSSEMKRAAKSLQSDLRSTVELSEARIRDFAIRQSPARWMHSQDGVTFGQIIRPLDSVGCYVPGGRFPLLSTLLMTVIPAQVAGAPRICVVSPDPRPELLAVAQKLGVTEFYRIGGAQAVAALAYGTESIGRVDKIVGPGNLYVTLAKKLVAFDCSIDMLAGPTEAVVVSHEGDPEWIASDLVAQAEHDPDARSIFITRSKSLAKQVLTCCLRQAEDNSNARQSLRRNGCVLVAKTRSEAMDWANRIAPEHITLSQPDVEKVRSAGSVFVGEYSPQAAGDYLTGPNHVLPTGGNARFRGGLTVADFVKIITVQQLSRNGLGRLAPAIVALAEAEGLAAHAQSVRFRCANA
jgi:histidinol dehydrogenase